MKITFEGHFNDILKEMARLLTEHAPKNTYEIMPEGTVTAVMEAQGPGPEAQGSNGAAEKLHGDIPVDTPVETPVKKTRSPAVEKMLAAKAAKAAAKKAAPSKTVDELLAQVAAEAEAEAAAPPMDPAEVVKVRQKTIEDLQAAYAGGHQKEVFELLSRFGNGAKSFRELPPEAFMPIRKAIDNGALT